jgi:hypothetical protein
MFSPLEELVLAITFGRNASLNTIDSRYFYYCRKPQPKSSSLTKSCIIRLEAILDHDVLSPRRIGFSDNIWKERFGNVLVAGCWEKTKTIRLSLVRVPSFRQPSSGIVEALMGQKIRSEKDDEMMRATIVDHQKDTSPPRSSEHKRYLSILDSPVYLTILPHWIIVAFSFSPILIR